MKKISILLVILVSSITLAVPAQAKLFRIGPRVGVDVSSLHFNTDTFNKENRVGFTAGLQAEISLPLGLCFDGSIMYVRRTIDAQTSDPSMQSISANRDYINVPINFKWKLGFPLIGKFVSPYLFTGPDFAFLASKQDINDAWKSHKVDVAWNVGVGIEFFSHLQVGASYGFGITKLSNLAGLTTATKDAIQGKNNNWTITAAYLF